MTKPVSRNLKLAAALALPLLLFAYSWASTYRLAQQGQDWLIPIKGYDPRDLLRGHFIQYQYDWPVETSRNGPFSISDSPYDGALCIEGKAPDMIRVTPIIFGSAEGASTRHCAIVARSSLGARREVRGLKTGILFTSQARAIALSAKLADPRQQGFIRVRIRPDGVMRPVDMAFRPPAAQ